MIVNIGGDDGDGQRYFGEHDQVRVAGERWRERERDPTCAVNGTRLTLLLVTVKLASHERHWGEGSLGSVTLSVKGSLHWKI